MSQGLIPAIVKDMQYAFKVASFSILSKVLASGDLGTNIYPCLHYNNREVETQLRNQVPLIDNLVSWRSNMLEREAEASSNCCNSLGQN